MILGLGTDIVEIMRIRSAIDNNPKFISRNFTEKEIAYFNSKNNNAQTIAGGFAAKEAYAKAVGTGFRGFSLIDVEILHDDMGKPYITGKRDGEYLISISHSDEYATAVVIRQDVSE